MSRSLPSKPAAGLALAGVLSMVSSLTASALSLTDVFSGPYRGEGQPSNLFNGQSAIIPRIINLMLFIVGILSIFMIIYGGIRYVLSGGDNAKVKDAMHTIMYSIVGLVVAILGYAVVGWVVSVVGAGGAANGSSATVTMLITSLLA